MPQRMPRFSVKTLLLSTTLIAVGAGVFSIFVASDRHALPDGIVGLLWFGSGALVGARLFGPFHRPWFESL